MKSSGICANQRNILLVDTVVLEIRCTLFIPLLRAHSV